MKAYRFLLGLCMAATMVACSNDDLVDPQAVDNRDHQAIGFTYKTGNMSRDNASLSTVAGDFGVWGYKTYTEGDGDGTGVPATETNYEVVFPHYLVGYGAAWAGGDGYDPTAAGATTFGDQSSTVDGKSYWFYEGLNSQFLKYWDTTAKAYYFYAHAPWTSNGVEFTPSTRKMEWKTAITQGNTVNSSVMYGAKKVDNYNGYADVPIPFTRLNAEVEIGFYEAINGYEVTLTDVEDHTVYGSVSMPDFCFAVPSVPNENNEGHYKWGTYVKSAKPTATFTDISATATDAPTVAWANFARTNAWYQGITIDQLSPGFWIFKNPCTSSTDYIGESATNPKMSPTKYYVVPADDSNENCGFLFFVTYTIKSEDSNETILVKDAMVYVPARVTQWQANKKYTYIFKITASAPGGTPTDPDDPTPPTPDDPILKPIVFDNCTVTDMTTGEKEEFEIGSGEVLSGDDGGSGSGNSGSGGDNSSSGDNSGSGS